MPDDIQGGTAAPTEAVAAVPAPAVQALAQEEPKWSVERASRERRKAVTDLGFESEEDAKAAFNERKAAKDAQKTAEQKLAETNTALASEKAERERLGAITREHAARMIGVLTPAQQKAVTDVAGDDPAAQLKAIHALAPLWAETLQAAKAAKIETAGASAPPRDAPAPVTPGSPPDHAAVYQQSRSANPFAAAAYGAQHPEVYDRKA